MMGDVHLGELKLRRLCAGELTGDEASESRAHAGECGRCRAKLRELEDEQRRFEAEIPFERFAAGVERAGRSLESATRSAPRARRWLYPLTALAAMCLLTVAARVLIPQAEVALNRTKGGGSIEVIVAGAGGGPQRQASATAPEPLSRGERIRIGYTPGGHRYLVSVSIDEKGEVTPLYPEEGSSLPMAGSAQVQYLPESVEFTGEGAERVVVILSDEPLEVERVKRAAREAFQRANGDVGRIDPLEVPGEQFHRTFLKP